MKRLFTLLVVFFLWAGSSWGQVVNSESFDGATFVPTGWTDLDIVSGNTWSRVTAGTSPTQTPHSGTGEAKFDAYDAAGGVRALITPVFTLAGIGSNTATVSTWMYRDGGYNTTPDKIDFYMNNAPNLTGATLLGTVNRAIGLAPTVATAGWYQYTYNIPAGFNTATNYFIIQATSAYGNNMYIDDVSWISYPPACVTPGAQPTALTLTPTTVTMGGSFTAAASVSKYLVVRSLSATLSATPVDGTTYTVGTSLGGGVVDYFGSATTFTSTGLNFSTLYYYFIFSANDACVGTPPVYLTANPLTGSQTTLSPPPPIHGTRTIPSADYPSFAVAFDSIVNKGIGTGGVIFNVTPGYTETATNLLMTANADYPPTVTNTILFQKNGSGANPILSRTDAGTLVTTALGGQGDAVVIIQGVDFVTFDGIDISSTNSGIEYGYYLRKASPTDGCKNVTIKNAAITMTKGTSAYVVGIYSSNNDAASLVTTASGITLTSTGGRNENVTITGNTISNVFAGIVLRGYNHASPYDFYDQNFVVGTVGAGNTIQNYAGNSASSSYGVYLIYQTNPTISYNTINNAGGGGANATSTLYGIFMSTSNALGNFIANNNTITLGQGATSGAHCIIVDQLGTSIAISNNTFNYGTFASTTTSYLISCSNSTPNLTVSGNQTGTIVKTGAGILYGYYNNGSPVSGTATINNNNFSNITLTGASTFYGIRQTASTSQITEITNNTISNITGGSNALYGVYQGYGATGSTINGNTVNGWTGTGSMYALYLGSSSPISLTAFNNNANGLTTTGVAAVYGIYNFTGTLNSIYKNKIYNLSASNASGAVHGIYLSGGTTTNVYNNFISDLKTPLANAATPLSGINVAGGTTVNLFYNTIYLNAASSGALFGSSAIYASTTPALTMRNNILVNTSTPKGAGITAAYRRSSATLTTYSATSDANAFYAGATQDATHAVYYDVAPYNVDAYKALVDPRDAISFRELPPFVNAATAPYDLKMQTTVATQCESGGIRVTTPIAITTDYEGDVRWGETGYTGTGTSPDVGADEFNGIPLDLLPPTIVYTPLVNTSSFANRTLTTTITDVSGVPTAGTGLPMLYWKKTGDPSFTGVQGLSLGSNQYSFTFGSGVILGDIVSYYIVAQDNAPALNVGAKPSAGATGFTYSPPACSTPPTTPSSYTIVGTICGTKTVGATGDYTTLTAAVADFNAKEMTCPVVFSLIDATYPGETFPIVINSNPGASATNTLTIKPATGITPTITGVAASGPIFRIKNNYTIFDGSNAAGGTSRDLTISNTSATAPQVVFIGSTGTTPITNVTLKNTIVINGVQTSTAVIVEDVTAVAGYFNNITIQNNSIQKAYMGIFVVATVAAGNGSGFMITGNDLNTSGANSIRLVGVYLQGVDGATITNNNIGNFANTADPSNITGIWLATSTVNTTVSGNTISAIDGTASCPRGIVISTAVVNSNLNITGNTISGMTSTSSGTTFGIFLFSTTGGVTIEKNSISNIKNTSSGGWGSVGLQLSSSLTGANISVLNNKIWDVAAYGYAGYTLTDNGYGIDVNSGSGYSIYFNTVNMNTDQTDVTGYPAAMNIQATVTGAGAVDLRDNIFSNTMTVGTQRYAIISTAANTVFSNINNNDYITTGPNLGYFGAANVLDLAAWKTASGQDANSITADPLFISATDFHPQQPLLAAGVAIPGITTDFAGITRLTPPSMGAYELPQVVTTAATAITSTGAALNGTVNGCTQSVGTSFEYGTSISYGSTAAAAPTPVTGSATTAISATLTGLTPPNTLYHYRAVGTVGTAIYNGADLTFTTSAIAPTVVTNAATSVTGTGAQLNGTVNANNSATTVTFEYGLTASYGTTVTAPQSPVSGITDTPVTYALTGLAPNTTYHFRAVGVNGAGTSNGLDLTFTTSAIAPTAVTNAATSVTIATAQLNGTVNANNSSTTVTFEYGLTASYGTVVSATQSPVTGYTDTPVSVSIAGLTVGTTYHFRVVAVNGAGTTNGADLTFFTSAAVAPVVTTTAATLVTGVTATVNGLVNANNASTVVTFEYGTTVSYGSTITATPSPVTGLTDVSVLANLTGLAPNTLYHFRAVGVNGGGTTNGADLTFTTGTIAPTVVTTAATLITVAGAQLNGTVNANNLSTTVTFEYGLTTGYGTIVTATQSPVSGYSVTPVSVSIAGLTVGTTYHFRVVGVNSAGTTNGDDMTFFTSSAVAPTVTTTAATLLTASTATVNGLVNANNSSTAVNFEYGTTIAYGSSVTATPSSVNGLTDVSVLANLVGLAPNTLYHFRAVGVNSGGTTNGADLTFTTGALAPDVVTQAATSIGVSTGTLNGTVNANNQSSTVTFEYGLTASYGSTIAGTPGTVTGNSVTPVVANVVGLSLNTTYHFRIVATNATGTSNGADLTFTTACPIPAAAGTISGPANVCKPSTGHVYTVAAIADATGYTWTLPTGATITSGGNTNSITVSFAASAASGNMTVKGTSTCGEGTVSPAFVVTIDPDLAVGTIASSQPVCYGLAPGLLTSTAPNGTAPTYQWQSSSDNITFTDISTATGATYQPGALTATTYFRQIQNSTGTCGGPLPTNVVTITVNALPVATAANSGPVCVGSTLNLTGGPAGMTTYAWTGPNGFTSAVQNPSIATVTTAAAGDYTLIVTNASGCISAGTSTTVVVNVNPVATAANSGPVCVGSTLNLTGGPAGMTTYAWTGPNGFTSAIQNPSIVSVTTAAAGDYTLIVTNASGCISAGTSTTVVVNVNPVATAANSGPVCVGSTLSLTGGPAAMTAYAWTGPNGFTSAVQNPSIASVTTAAAGDYTLIVTNASGCISAGATTTAVVNVNPVATATNSGPVCVGSTLNLTGGPAAMTTYAWTGPNGFTSAVQNPSIANVTTVAAGDYTLIVTNANGCISAGTSTTVVVNVNPVATAANNGPVCEGSTLNLTGSPSGMTTYAWTGPNGFTANVQSPAVANITPAAAGAYTLVVTNANGCFSAAASTTVLVNPAPVPTASNNGPLCAGSTLFLVGGPEGMNAYAWSGPNGFTSNTINPTVFNVTPADAGVYMLTITNALGCTGSIGTTVVINALPAPTAANNGPMCEGLTLNLFGQPSGATSYSWSGPNGFTSNVQNPTIANVTAAASGQYVLVVANTSGCQNSASTSVTIYAKPATTATNNGPLCAGSTLNLTGAPAGMTSYAWSGPAGFTSNVQNPVIANVTTAASGVYTLLATNASGCSASANTTVVVNAIPGAPVIAEDNDVLTSSAPAGNQWYFNGVLIAGATEQTYSATLSGNYYCVVTLNGCASPQSNILYVIITGLQEIPSSASFVVYPVPNEGRFNASILYPVESTFTIAIYNQLGSKIFELKDVKTISGKVEKLIDLRPIPSGIYSVVFTNSELKVIRKVLVNK